jgi:uncharacterized protein YgbK (DUF1537 family)
MASGIEMMMRSFGVDPAKIMQAMQPVIEQTVGVLTKELQTIREQQARIEAKLDALKEQLENGVIVDAQPNHDPLQLAEGGKLDNA